MTRIMRATAGLAAASIVILGLAGCGGSSSPTTQASAILAKTGATGDGPAYKVTNNNESSSACNPGDAEADGHLSDNSQVNVCVATSNAERANGLADAIAAKSDVPIQVGKTTLVYVTSNGVDSLPKARMEAIAAKIGGTYWG
jgi:hypothetical protein